MCLFPQAQCPVLKKTCLVQISFEKKKLAGVLDSLRLASVVVRYCHFSRYAGNCRDPRVLSDSWSKAFLCASMTIDISRPALVGLMFSSKVM